MPHGQYSVEATNSLILHERYSDDKGRHDAGLIL
jgi:hypothetical protein